jgi:hypothetical protein
MVSTGLTAAVLGMDFMLGQYFTVLTLFSVPFDLITIALCLFVLHESPKYAVDVQFYFLISRYLLITRQDTAAAKAAIYFYHGRNVNLNRVMNSYRAEAEFNQQVTLKTVLETPCLRRATLVGCAGFTIHVSSGGLNLYSTQD